MNLTVTIPVSDAVIEDALVGAICDDYWHRIVRIELAPEFESLHASLNKIPLLPGCALIGEDVWGDRKQYRLDRAALQSGLSVMALEHPKSLTALVARTDDCDMHTCGCYLQCCLLGKHVYG